MASKGTLVIFISPTRGICNFMYTDIHMFLHPSNTTGGAVLQMFDYLSMSYTPDGNTNYEF